MDYNERHKPAKKKPNIPIPHTHDGVSESSPYLPDRKVEQLLSDIVARLERIEGKIDENVYPPESAFKPEFIKSVKRAQQISNKGRERRTIPSMISSEKLRHELPGHYSSRSGLCL